MLREYGSVLPDNLIQDVLKKTGKIVDSTTIRLFKDVLSCVDRKAVYAIKQLEYIVSLKIMMDRLRNQIEK